MTKGPVPGSFLYLHPLLHNLIQFTVSKSIYSLNDSHVLSPAQTSPPTLRLVYLTARSPSLTGCFTGSSNLSPRLNYNFLSNLLLLQMIFKMKEQRISIGGFSSEAEVWLYKSQIMISLRYVVFSVYLRMVDSLFQSEY